MTHEDLVILTGWMAENDYTTADIVAAVEKPWKYEDELAQAKEALKAETEVAEDQGVIWDNPESPKAKRCITELRELKASLRADREAGYPSEQGSGPTTDSGRSPVLRLVK